MELRQLEYFVTSAEEKSFYQAGQTLFTSQPAISKAIGNLEKELGAKLFERTNRGLRLTARGESLYHYAKNILRQVDFIKDVSQEMEESLAVASYPSHRIATMLTDFYLQQEDLHLDYREGTVQDIIELVHTGISQFGIVYIAPQQEGVFGHILSHKQLEFVPMQQATLCVYVGEQHPLWGSGEAIDTQTMGALSYIRGVRDYFSVEHHFDNVSLNQLNTAHFSDKVLTNSDHLVSLMLEKTDLCYLGIDTTVVNSDGKLPIQSEQTQLTLGYIKPKNGILSATAEQFLEHLNSNITKSYSNL